MLTALLEDETQWITRKQEIIVGNIQLMKGYKSESPFELVSIFLRDYRDITNYYNFYHIHTSI